MKTRIATFVTLFILSAVTVSAESFTSFRISDRAGNTLNVLSKVESVTECFSFSTREVFEEVTAASQGNLLDITPFIKEEQEVKEELPVYGK